MTPWNTAAGPSDYLAAVRDQVEADQERERELRAYFAYAGVWEWIMTGRVAETLGPSATDGVETFRRYLAGARRPALSLASPALPGFCACGQRLPHGPWPHRTCPRCRVQAQTGTPIRSTSV